MLITISRDFTHQRCTHICTHAATQTAKLAGLPAHASQAMLECSEPAQSQVRGHRSTLRALRVTRAEPALGDDHGAPRTSDATWSLSCVWYACAAKRSAQAPSVRPYQTHATLVASFEPFSASHSSSNFCLASRSGVSAASFVAWSALMSSVSTCCSDLRVASSCFLVPRSATPLLEYCDRMINPAAATRRAMA